MKSAWIAVLLLVACGGSEEPTTPHEPFELKPPVIDFEAVATARQTRETSQAQVQAGYQCGWHAGWIETLRLARKDGPSAFRSKAVGRAFGWGGILLVAGLGGTLLLAWSLPRLRRRKAHNEAKAHTKADRPSDVVPTWGSTHSSKVSGRPSWMCVNAAYSPGSRLAGPSYRVPSSSSGCHSVVRPSLIASDASAANG